MVNSTAELFHSQIPQETPEEMRAYLEQDAFIFSGLRTHTQLAEARSYLKDENGNLRAYQDFEQKVLKLNQQYNQNYLEAEYEFAAHSSMSVANWANLQEDTERYWLEYRTAGDDRVRVNHQQLNGICLPKDDAFWLEYYPPNGWRCRCVAVEVLAREKNLTDSEKAQELGELATTQIGKNGKNKLAMFRFNPGIQKKMFPPNNSYKKVVGADKVKKTIENIKPLKSTKDLNIYFTEFAKKNEDLFARGFKEIKITKQRGVNGFADMNGVIALKSDITKLCISGINNIKAGIPTTFEQEKALSTLHHEIMHNANKHGNMTMTRDAIKTMELANEFVSRKTLSQFMERLGGKLYNKSLMDNRDNTGYNTMVINYDKIIKWAKADINKVIKSVRDTLIEDKYTEQINGLTNAIDRHSIYNIESKNIKGLIHYAKQYSNDNFDKLLNLNEDLKKLKNQ